MADLLEQQGDRYAFLDLDFLSWGCPGSDEEGWEERMLLRNLIAVVGNYLDAGVDASSSRASSATDPNWTD